jgi:hypothetical protein
MLSRYPIYSLGFTWFSWTTDRRIQDTLKSNWADNNVKLRKFSTVSGTDSVATLEMGTESGPETLGHLSNLDSALCPKCFCWIPSSRRLQDLQIQDRTLKQAKNTLFRKIPDVLLKVYWTLRSHNKCSWNNVVLWANDLCVLHCEAKDSSDLTKNH